MTDDRSWVEAEGLPLENPDPLDAAKASRDPLDTRTADAPPAEPVVTQGSSDPDGTIGGDTGYAEAHPDGKQAD